MVTSLNIEVPVVVSPNETIIAKLAHDYVVRAQTHNEHRLMFEATQLTVQEIESYFHDILLGKAQLVEAFRTGGKDKRHHLNKLYVPVALTPFITSIGDVKTAEYHITVVTDGAVLKLDDAKRMEISSKLFDLNSFMPVERNQFSVGREGDDAMFAIMDEQLFTGNDVVLRAFTGRPMDNAYVQIAAVLGLKVQDSSMKCLFPTFGTVDIDHIRDQFRSGEGFKKVQA